jgi:hypothetical protein
VRYETLQKISVILEAEEIKLDYGSKAMQWLA